MKLLLKAAESSGKLGVATITESRCPELTVVETEIVDRCNYHEMETGWFFSVIDLLD